MKNTDPGAATEKLFDQVSALSPARRGVFAPRSGFAHVTFPPRPTQTVWYLEQAQLEREMQELGRDQKITVEFKQVAEFFTTVAQKLEKSPPRGKAQHWAALRALCTNAAAACRFIHYAQYRKQFLSGTKGLADSLSALSQGYKGSNSASPNAGTPSGSAAAGSALSPDVISPHVRHAEHAARSPSLAARSGGSTPSAAPPVCLPLCPVASTARAAHRNASPQGRLHARDRTDTGGRARQAWQ